MEQKYDHLLSEKEMQDLWQKEKTYSSENNPGIKYSIDTPPPTVSGALHIGHIFSYTHTDIIARYKRMSGHSVFYPFGFDDNGLATERFVEKKREINPHNITRSEFIKICLEESSIAKKQFEDLWLKIGLSVDWNLSYSTIDRRSRIISQASFIELYNKNYIYRKYEPSLYCTTCRTTVAQAELDDAEKKSQFNDIIFKSENGSNLIISTTRPELLYSCVALLYHPEDVRYKHLKDTHAYAPIYKFKIPIYPEETVDINKGSGLVMSCTFGDKNDILWFKKHKLDYKPSIGTDGRWLKETDFLAGLNALQAREKIIEALKNSSDLCNIKEISHTVSVHERCKKEIEYLALSQWFLNILDHKDKLIEQADTINWYPSFMKARYKNWVENISWDWCLSRQRFYGIPFPVWHCQNCNKILLADIDQLPVDPQEQNYNKLCPNCSSADIKPDTDVMDTWNTSSLTPYICASLENPADQINKIFSKDIPFLPMDMRPQAHDIIRTWAFYTITKAYMHNNTIPWKDIVISGHVLSNEKEKISKSQSNSPLKPENLLKNYPADAIRYWTASGSLGYDISFSESQLKIGQKLIVKLWNAFKFIDTHLNINNNKNIVKPKTLGNLNQWILHLSSSCFNQYKNYLELYEYGLALDTVEKFFWNTFCDNYLELIKDQLFKPEKYSPEQIQATLWTLDKVGLQILQLYAPFLPYITEVIYQKIYKTSENKKSIHQTQYNNIQENYDFAQSVTAINFILQITEKVRKIKTENQISLKTDLEKLTIHVPHNLALYVKEEEQVINGIAKALETVIIEEPGITQLIQNDDKWEASINFF